MVLLHLIFVFFRFVCVGDVFKPKDYGEESQVSFIATYVIFLSELCKNKV